MVVTFVEALLGYIFMLFYMLAPSNALLIVLDMRTYCPRIALGSIGPLTSTAGSTTAIMNDSQVNHGRQLSFPPL